MLRVIILVIALAAGSLAAWLALTMRTEGTAPAPAAAAAPAIPMEDVLVASADLAQGQSIDEAKLRWQPWPKDAVQQGYITRKAKPDAIATSKGAVVRTHVVAGEPVREERLARGSAGLLASLLTPGKRAVAIRVSAESTAGGFILPNDRVDVIQTLTRQAGTQSESLSRTLISNIRVLAVDQKADDAKADAAVVAKTVTLELSPVQAETIATGQATGALSLALRSVSDNEDDGSTRRESTAVRFLRAGRSEMVRTQ